MGKTKKQLEQIVLKKRQYRSNQGRSPEKVEANYKVLTYSVLGILIIAIGMGLKNYFFG
tara:strand:+ start:2589 stop:2765 length:177 start_codon:yes stop_codon:yes gene_type:complete